MRQLHGADHFSAGQYLGELLPPFPDIDPVNARARQIQHDDPGLSLEDAIRDALAEVKANDLLRQSGEESCPL
jgi:hypothetical protein